MLFSRKVAMSKSKPTTTASYKAPNLLTKGRPECPVCGKGVFSRSGIHPQCAIEHSEREAAKALRESQALAAAAALPAAPVLTTK